MLVPMGRRVRKQRLRRQASGMAESSDYVSLHVPSWATALQVVWWMRWSLSPKHDGGHRCRNRIVGSSLCRARRRPALPSLFLDQTAFFCAKPFRRHHHYRHCYCCATSHHLRKAILPGVSLTIQAEICIATPWTLPAKALLAHS